MVCEEKKKREEKAKPRGSPDTAGLGDHGLDTYLQKQSHRRGLRQCGECLQPSSQPASPFRSVLRCCARFASRYPHQVELPELSLPARALVCGDASGGMRSSGTPFRVSSTHAPAAHTRAYMHAFLLPFRWRHTAWPASTAPASALPAVLPRPTMSKPSSRLLLGSCRGQRYDSNYLTHASPSCRVYASFVRTMRRTMR